MYIISFTPKLSIFGNAFGCIPSLGGSKTIISGFSLSSSITLSTSPAINSQLFILLSLALSLAASTASSTISTPTAFFAFDAKSCAIVPVPLYRSYTTLPDVSPIYSPAFSYSFSAPRELVWKNEKVLILNLSPKSSSKISALPYSILVPSSITASATELFVVCNMPLICPSSLRLFTISVQSQRSFSSSPAAI